ncbi:type VI secretion system protein TssL [Loktanella sp. D2R18]|uniref:type VI secretion system protein TssL, long form n=1 Tax=Rhodobacterales TaxID=204455 RepID=UPI000DEB9665|nr:MULTISPECIES: type VI secretion system protein TssL, long form [Rhodobacterales]MDO6590556.1 type VI secretion system protein TssL, long form [Yoonia sp. 1_MG-2023]RBW41272.1 type VI secretion system protein TssL [Loktanella sp. D2R18]
MTHDDPFAEPTDTDKTVILPNPGGRRPVTPTPPRVAQPTGRPPASSTTAPAGPQVAIGSAATGMNVLNAAASSLFMLVGRMRNRAQHDNPAQLRDSVVAEVRAFENNALQGGAPAQSVKIARYAICATIDDVILNTPWGGQSNWAQQSLVGTFHKETHGGDRFFDLLEHLEKEPGTNRDLLEFMYMCLSLGFEGRLRVENRGAEKHTSIRNNLARLIRTHRGPLERDFSLRWKGVTLAHRPLSAWMPVWLTGGFTIGATCLAFFGFSFALSVDTERLRGQLAGLNVNGVVTLARSAPPPPPPPPTVQEVEEITEVETFLETEVARGLVTVLNEGNVLTVRILGTGMFGSGSDVLAPEAAALIDRIAAALNEKPGRILVAGHSDNVPINTARFPSNLFLSLARATSVMDQMSATLTDPDRISAEGRADAEPIATNDTAEGRAQNRRIEVILVKAG